MHLNGNFSSETALRQKLDFIYEKSKSGKSFHGIVEVAFNEVTIITAIHKIKANQGAKTAGTDKKTIDKYLQMEKAEFISLVQNKVKNYKPKPAKRIYIRKENGKMRPLGIPTILDRIIQECIRIVLEPIVEARFYPHSFGFRGYRSVHDAVYQVFHYANCNLKKKPWTVIEGDIKSFFDNLNHRILLKKLWNMGVHDKRVIAIIKVMLKAGYLESDVYHNTEFGTMQGGILSPLLANVYLNSFDWSVGRMYQEPKQRTSLIQCDRIRLRYQGVLPKYLIRYADDWVILVQNDIEAKRLLHKLQKYFRHRLKLELSEEKTVITDMRTTAVNFLGFSIKVRKTSISPPKQMAMCYPNPKRLSKQINSLCKEVKKTKECSQDKYRAIHIENVNAKIIGLAEHIKHFLSSKAYHKIDYAVNKCAFKTFKQIYGKKKVLDYAVPMGNLNNRPQRHQGRKDVSMAVKADDMWVGFTKAYITGSQRINRPFCQKLSPFTSEGRRLHLEKTNKYAPLSRPALYDDSNLLKYAVLDSLYNLEYFMNREYAYNREKGVCRCCRNGLNVGHRHCHHIDNSLPTDKINKVPNLAWVCETCHGAIHGKTIPSYMTAKMKSKLEKLRAKLTK